MIRLGFSAVLGSDAIIDLQQSLMPRAILNSQHDHLPDSYEPRGRIGRHRIGRKVVRYVRSAINSCLQWHGRPLLYPRSKNELRGILTAGFAAMRNSAEELLQSHPNGIVEDPMPNHTTKSALELIARSITIAQSLEKPFPNQLSLQAKLTHALVPLEPGATARNDFEYAVTLTLAMNDGLGFVETFERADRTVHGIVHGHRAAALTETGLNHVVFAQADGLVSFRRSFIEAARDYVRNNPQLIPTNLQGQANIFLKSGPPSASSSRHRAFMFHG